MSTSSFETDSSTNALSCYAVGTSIFAKRHKPPEPCGGQGYLHNYPADSSEVEAALQTASQFEWVVSHPPTPGKAYIDDTRCFTIARPIRMGDQCNAQVLLTHDGLVAKIYDPMYYTWADEDFPAFNTNVSRKADHAYINEVAAYEELASDRASAPFLGTIVPKFFGSWTLDVPFTTVDGEEKMREVRMILLEYVLGTCMCDIDPDKLTPFARQNIMFKLIEAETDIKWTGGVSHDDVYPRNVIISGNDYEDPDLRVCIIDFDVAFLSRIYWGRRNPRRGNPLFHWLGMEYLYSGWLPEEEEDSNAWMWDIRGDGRNGKYDKVIPDPKRRNCCKFADDMDDDAVVEVGVSEDEAAEEGAGQESVGYDEQGSTGHDEQTDSSDKSDR